jgi:cytochrome c-type biogenesis protein CcmH
MRRISQIGFLALLMIFALGSADTAVRYNELNHKMMCACGCGQVLGECNHLGCPDSERMLGELRTAISKGESDTAILEAFQAKYGPTILAAPMLTRFNIVAWVVPPVVLLLGIFVTFALVRKWKLRTVSMPDASPIRGFDRIRDQIRKETEI